MKKRVLALLLATMMLLGLAACSSDEGTDSGKKNSDGGSGKQKITIAIGNAYKPFCYLNENEEPDGYEYDLFQLVAEKMSDKYDVEVVCDSWDNLFVGLESGKYDVVSHHMAYSDERAEKYTVSEESLMYFGSYRVIYKAGRTDISDLDSLAGKTMANAPTDNIGKALVAYNEEHPDNPIILQETFPSLEAMIAGIENGLYDGYTHTYFDLKTKYLDAYPDADLEMSDVPLLEDEEDCGTYALLKKGNTDLQADFDAAIKALREEGKIGELCVEWFGEDYSVNPQ